MDFLKLYKALTTTTPSSCVNTRDNQPGNTCAKQLKTGGTCEKFLNWKDCDKECKLCSCSTATGTNQEHCSGHGTCEATCTKDACSDARCKCDDGWRGDKCQGINVIVELPRGIFYNHI